MELKTSDMDLLKIKEDNLKKLAERIEYYNKRIADGTIKLEPAPPEPRIQSVTPEGKGLLGLADDPELLQRIIARRIEQLVAKRGGTFQWTDVLRQAVERITSWMAYPKNRPPFIILCGSVGTGKTTLTRAVESMLLWSYEIQKAKTQGYKSIAYFLQFARAEEIPGMFNQEEFEARCGKFTDLCFTRVLVVDDLGTETLETKYYGTAARPSTLLINQRYENMLPTIMSTNLTPDGIADRYGDRIFDRLQEIAEIVPMLTSSFRDRKKFPRWQ